jgi:hypothetical protein
VLPGLGRRRANGEGEGLDLRLAIVANIIITTSSPPNNVDQTLRHRMHHRQDYDSGSKPPHRGKQFRDRGTR